MANTRLAMRRIREIMRLCLDLRLGQTQVAESLGISSSTVNRIMRRAKDANLSWPLPEALDDSTLERLLYPPPEKGAAGRPEPDWNHIHQQLKQKGVTLVLLWQEFKEQYPSGYQLSQFCEKYREWRSKLNISMRQTHKAGEKAFSDFAGAKFEFFDSQSGTVKHASLFVCTLGASNYTFADAFLDQSSQSWCDGHALSFEFFTGVPAIIVPDNPKAAINKPCRYEPEPNFAFQAMASHFGCAVIPARVRHPKDKAKVENAVGVVTRWIYARLRNRKFFSLDEIRLAIRPLLDDLNNRPFKKLPGSRRTHFESIDRPALKPLPSAPYEFSKFHKVMVGIDHHVEFEKHWYSVPFQLARKKVELRVTNSLIEVLHGGNRIASHVRSFHQGGTTTLDVHRPAPHRAYTAQSREVFLNSAKAIGNNTFQVIELLLNESNCQEETFKRCNGILKLGKQNGNDRLEAACSRGLATGATSFRSLRSILQMGLDRRPLPEKPSTTNLRIVHSNIRGANYFNTKGDEKC